VGPDDWIVVFRPGVGDPPGLARRLVAEHGGTLRFTYRNALAGFAATLPAPALEEIRRNPNVLYVEHDAVATVSTEESAGSWGLDRIDQRALPLSGTYVYETEGGGVRAYVIDTGIRTTHVEFEGRAWRGVEADFVFDGRAGDDCHGHGTHVGGTIGGNTYGVAKAVDLVAVRVLNCQGSGSYAAVIAGVDWVTGDYQSRGVPAVANMSLGGPYSQALNDALAASVEAGVVHVVAAGNDNSDACLSSPSAEPQALTVGSTTSSDGRSSFSNWGYCLDLFAPGSGITSATAGSDTQTGTWSGTSMASPHVAGVAVLYLGVNPGANPTTVKYHVLSQATTGVVLGAGSGSPDKLLHSLITGGGGPVPPAAPGALLASAASPSAIDLFWSDNSSDEDGFRLERSLDGTGFSLLATLAAGEVAYQDAGLDQGMTYWYRVRAYNGGGGSAWSNVASATTEGEPPLPPPDETFAEVFSVSEVEVYRQGRFSYGLVGVAVVETPAGTLLPGVTVTGDWYKSGETSPFRSSTGVTDSFGFLGLESGKVANASGLHFCVTGLSGDGIGDGTAYPSCSPGFTPGEPPPPPPPGAPSGLTASFTAKAGGRVELSWTPGGGACVDVYRNGSFLGSASDGGRYNDRDGSVGDAYQVCVAGAPPADATLCSNPATAG
jgi:subtilisin family serine protease